MSSRLLTISVRQVRDQPRRIPTRPLSDHRDGDRSLPEVPRWSPFERFRPHSGGCRPRPDYSLSHQSIKPGAAGGIPSEPVDSAQHPDWMRAFFPPGWYRQHRLEEANGVRGIVSDRKRAATLYEAVRSTTSRGKEEGERDPVSLCHPSVPSYVRFTVGPISVSTDSEAPTTLTCMLKNAKGCSERGARPVRIRTAVTEGIPIRIRQNDGIVYSEVPSIHVTTSL